MLELLLEHSGLLNEACRTYLNEACRTCLNESCRTDLNEVCRTYQATAVDEVLSDQSARVLEHCTTKAVLECSSSKGVLE